MRPLTSMEKRVRTLSGGDEDGFTEAVERVDTDEGKVVGRIDGVF